jgi:predicted nucleic acid-binding protein
VRVERFCSRLRVLYPDDGFAESYGQLVATLKRLGRTPQVMDALIATLAIRDGAHLVTRDRNAFVDVPGLAVITY